MKYKKRPLCLLLTFLLCFLTAVPALADQTPLEIRQGKKTYFPYENEKGNGWSYSVKGTAKTLTLGDFEGESITVGLDDEFQGDKMTITLAEGTTNKLLESLSAWIFMDTGNYAPTLKIQGKGKLIVWQEPSRVKSLKSSIQSAEKRIAKAEQQLPQAQAELLPVQEELAQAQAEFTQIEEAAERAYEEAEREEAAAKKSSSSSTEKRSFTIGSTMSTRRTRTPEEEEARKRVSSLESQVRSLEDKVSSLENQIKSARETIEKCETDLVEAKADTNVNPAIYFDEGIKVILDDSLVMVGGPRETDREPLSFAKKSLDWGEKLCPVTPDGYNAAYVEIAPAGLISQGTESSPEVPQEAPVEETPVAPSLPTQFSDVPEGAYYVEPVKWAIENDIINGVSETNFAPAETCRRGEVATFLWRAKGCPEPVTTDNPFTDVDPSSAFYKAILWAAENGITAGTSDTTFSPGNPCTRAHVVTFLWRSLGKPEAVGDTPLADTFPPGHYTDAVRWADAAGLLNGTGETFAPSTHCPRSDIVTYLYRVLT